MSSDTFTTIESYGTTTLALSGSNYYLIGLDGSSVELSYDGAPVVVGEFAAWTPIAAEKMATGYEVAWSLPGADRYTIWYLDDSGNLLSSPIGTVAGESNALESFETSFQQDLNGDGVVGLSPPTVIEAFGSTTLIQNGGNYFLDGADGSSVELNYGGAPLVVAELGAWTPIGAEKTASGYEVAWKLPGTTPGSDQYMIWYTDDSGNFLSAPVTDVYGQSSALESFETSFQQDLNGDGVIGLPPPAVIEAFGSTTLVQSDGNYFLDGADGSSVELNYGGAPVAAGEFDAWTPIGAEKTASGYEVAWKLPGTTPESDQYAIWYTDNNGNYQSAPIATTNATSTDLESFENSFQRDLNGDGTIGVVCFAAGTRILTCTGERSVESLLQGDIVLTLSGDELSARPVQWIGRRRIDITAYQRPEKVAPIRIRRGAFADNTPHTDLLVSPDHAIFVEGKLICARQLVNGTTVLQELGWTSVDYYHVELDAHAILLAEGLPTESYLDTGNRGFFGNSDGPLILHPDLTDESDYPAREAGSCAPFVSDEADVLPVWKQLADRAAALGQPVPQLETTTDPALRLVAKERTVKPIYIDSKLAIFAVPRGATEVRLVSRFQAPTTVRPWLEDQRLLGVRVSRIILRSAHDLREIPVDHPDIAKGWWAVERDDSILCRWTNGDAALRLPELDGTTMLEVHFGGSMIYTVDAVSDPVRRAA